MVVCEVRLVSANGRERDRPLGVVEICNVGGSADLGDYSVRLTTFSGKSTWRSGSVKSFPRKLGGFDLLFRSLRVTVGQRNPEPELLEAMARQRVRGAGVAAMRAMVAAVDGIDPAAKTPQIVAAVGAAIAWLDQHAPAGRDG